MSIPNDLEVASTFALQDIPPVPQQSTAVVSPIPIKEENQEAMDVDKKDPIDTAISRDIKTEEGYESSDLELSSDSEEEDSSDSSEEEETATSKTCTNKREILYDEEDEEVFADGIVKTTHEIIDIIVEKPNFELTLQTEIILAGSIFQIIGNVIVIHCRPGCEYSTLDQGSLLVYENREIMGEVFETFGPIARPFYSVRFNDAKEINIEFGKIGASVYYVPTYQKTQIVETEALRRFKGTDASNVFDEEVGEEEMEFSDDEKEMEFRKKRNREKKMRKMVTSNGQFDTEMEKPPFNRGGGGRHRRQPRPPRDLPSDFDSALAAYEGYQQQPLPSRQQQSYADLEEYSTAPATQPQPQQQQQNYQTPAELVSALFKSYNGQLPTQPPAQLLTELPATTTQPATKKSIRSLFSVPPPKLDDDE